MINNASIEEARKGLAALALLATRVSGAAGADCTGDPGECDRCSKVVAFHPHAFTALTDAIGFQLSMLASLAENHAQCPNCAEAQAAALAIANWNAWFDLVLGAPDFGAEPDAGS